MSFILLEVKKSGIIKYNRHLNILKKKIYKILYIMKNNFLHRNYIIKDI